jgi:hypothetical protein
MFAFAVYDDSQLRTAKAQEMLRQLMHALYDMRARNTTTSSGNAATATGLFISNVAALGLESMPTLQRLLTFRLPAVADKSAMGPFHEFKSEAAHFCLPGLLSLSHAADVKGVFAIHLRDFQKLTDLNR